MKFLCLIISLVFGMILTNCQSKKIESKLPFKKRIEDLITNMTLEEKIDQLGGMGITSGEFGDMNAQVFGTKGNERLGISDLIMGHGITGVRSGRDASIRGTYFCTPVAIASAWDTDLYYRVGVAMAREMVALKQNLNLGPTANIIRHPLGGRNWECYSEDPFLISRMIVPYVKAMQENNIICGPKHFVANNQETNRFDINNEIDERALREIYLPGFKAAVVEGGALNIMGAYNRLNGTFMCENKYLLTDILRDEWNFEGFVLSDFGKGVRSTIGSINAGLNIEMHNTVFYGDNLLKAVKEKKVSEESIDHLLKEKLYAMFKVGMFDNYPSLSKSAVHTQEHQEIALEVARKNNILLKNHKNILPLDISKIKSLAVIGPNAKRFPNLPVNTNHYAYYLQGGGSGRCYYIPEAVISPYQGIKDLVHEQVEIHYARGCETPNTPEKQKTNSQKLIDEAVIAAKKSDVVILVMGLSGFNETEGKDRTNAKLPEEQEQLIKAVTKVNPNTVVVLIAGSYIEMNNWYKNVPALLFSPYSGEKIGQGLAETLFGNVNPSGKLTFSYPYSVSQYPEGSIFTGGPYSNKKKSNVYTEGIFVGYRYFDKYEKDVLFPFGYGLSYTQFKYSNLKIAENTITVDITNTGGMEGDEIVQMYISDMESSVERPVKELKGFKKLSLEPGETETVEFELSDGMFAFYDVKNKSWTVERGEYEIQIGSSSRDIRLKNVINR